MQGPSCQGSGLQTEAACSAEDVVSGQITSTELPQAGERLPPMHDTPVVYENHLKETREGSIIRLHWITLTFISFCSWLGISEYKDLVAPPLRSATVLLCLASVSPTARSLAALVLLSTLDVQHTIAEQGHGGLCLSLNGHSCCICWTKDTTILFELKLKIYHIFQTAKYSFKTKLDVNSETCKAQKVKFFNRYI